MKDTNLRSTIRRGNTLKRIFTRGLRLAVVCLALVSALYAFTAADIRVADAAETGITIEVLPSAPELPDEGELKVHIIARNTTTETFENLKLERFANAGIRATVVETPELDLLAPNSDHVWTILLSKSTADPVLGRVNIRVDYQRRDPEKGLIPRVAFNSFEVKSRSHGPISEIADVKLETTITTINERRPGKVFVVISNKSNDPINIKKVSPSHLDYIVFEPAEVATTMVVGPREAKVVPFDVRTTDAVKSGKYLLLFEVSIDWGEGKRGQSGSLIATQTVDVGVFGESEVLAPLAIPSFIVLPGFLMVAVWSLLWGLLKPWGKEFPFKINTTEFWLIAISLSLVMALWLYPLLTGTFSGLERNYLDQYGFNDIAYVWTASILLAITGYLVLIGLPLLVLWIIARLREQNIAERTYSASDTTMATLEKLGRNNMGLNLPQKLIDINGQQTQVFLLEDENTNKASLWVAPAMTLTGWSQVSQAVQDEIQTTLSETGRPETLLAILRRNRTTLQLSWPTNAQFNGPEEKPKAEVTPTTSRNVIVDRGIS